MSDIESIDYYSDSTEDSSDDEEQIEKKKLHIPSKNINAVKKFGDYAEDESESESEIDDSEPDDNFEDDEDDVDEKKGGGKDDEAIEEGEILEDDETEDKDEDDDDIEIDDEGEPVEKQPSPIVKPKKTSQLIIDNEDEYDDEDEYDENYLQKFDNDVNKNYINEFHPECLNHNSDEVSKLSNVIRDENNIIIDPLHKTLPFLTKYEKARILGQRAKQIETGAKPFVKVPENIIDAYIIAELELREKKIPFIIKRPIPNGGFEYWNIKDLENINF
jgi:DNA-directed RNA polymerase subunit K/omega